MKNTRLTVDCLLFFSVIWKINGLFYEKSKELVERSCGRRLLSADLGFNHLNTAQQKKTNKRTISLSVQTF
jgi:hypothetical protein